MQSFFVQELENITLESAASQQCAFEAIEWLRDGGKHGGEDALLSRSEDELGVRAAALSKRASGSSASLDAAPPVLGTTGEADTEATEVGDGLPWFDGRRLRGGGAGGDGTGSRLGT